MTNSHIRNQRPSLSLFAMIGDREKILEVGADDYISKPIDTRELPKVVKKILGS